MMDSGDRKHDERVYTAREKFVKREFGDTAMYTECWTNFNRSIPVTPPRHISFCTDNDGNNLYAIFTSTGKPFQPAGYFFDLVARIRGETVWQGRIITDPSRPRSEIEANMKDQIAKFQKLLDRRRKREFRKMSRGS